MATRPCLRCCKLVPDSAAFCRRCGLALGPGAIAAPLRPSGMAADFTHGRRTGGRGPSFTFLPALLVIGMGLAVLTASSHHPRPCRTSLGRLATARANGGEGNSLFGSGTCAPGASAAGAVTDASPLSRFHWNDLRDSSPPRADNGPTEATQPPARRAPARAKNWSVPVAVAPSITAFDGSSAAAGQSLTIRGRGFTGTQRVLFAGAPTARSAAVRAEAQFQVRDDGTLVAVVPELGRGERDVTIAVVTPLGAAVTVPMFETPTSPRQLVHFLIISEGATVTPGRGSTVFVERGGCAVAASGSVLFLQSGAGVERARTDCLIVRETDNPVTYDLSVTPVLEVRALTPCRVDALFRYTGQW